MEMRYVNGLLLWLSLLTFVFTQKFVSKNGLLQINGDITDEQLTRDHHVSAVSEFITHDDKLYSNWMENYYFDSFPKLSYMASFMDILDTESWDWLRMVQDEHNEYLTIEFNLFDISKYINAIRLFYTGRYYMNDVIRLRSASPYTHGNLMITSLSTEVDTFKLVQDRVTSRINASDEVQQQSFGYNYAQSLAKDIDIILQHILPFVCQEIVATDTETEISNKINEIYSRQAGAVSSKEGELVHEYVTSPYLQELVVFMSSIPHEVTCNNKLLYTNMARIAYNTSTTFNGNNATLFITIKDIYSFYYHRTMTYRHIYSLPSQLFEEQNENLFTKLLTYNGEGSFSSIFFDCMNNTETTITSGCGPVRVKLTPYNNVIATLGMLLLPSTVYTGSGLSLREENESKSYNQTLCNGKYSRALIGGLGGGELHQFLLKHHPCLYVDSVEVNEEVVLTAHQYLGLENQICNIHHVSTMKSIDKYDTLEPSCRSSVIIGDIFEYVRHVYSDKRHHYYDFIITDIYDENTALHDGTSNSASNADVNSGIQSLAQLKSILNPDAGIIFFHLHYDNQYEIYEEAIKQTFQESGEVLALTPSFNSRVLAVSNYRFQDHPCHNSRLQFAQNSIKYGIKSGYPSHITYGYIFAYHC